MAARGYVRTGHVPSGKLSCNWLIMLVTTVTPISSHVKDKNSIFTARDEDMTFQ